MSKLNGRPLVIFRDFLDKQIEQDVNNDLYNATKLLDIWNSSRWDNRRMNNYIASPETKAFITLLESKECKWLESSHYESSIIRTRKISD